MELKILSVDCPLVGKGIEDTSFYESLSFSDYDVVIIDPSNISDAWVSKIRAGNDGSLITYSDTDGGFSKYLVEIMNMRSQETLLLLNRTGGIVICFLRSNMKVLSYARSSISVESSHLSIYSWIPHHFIAKKLVLSPYFGLTMRFGKEIGEINRSHPFGQYFLALRDKIFFEAIIDDESALKVSTIIARNKVGNVIALEIPFGKGKFIFLPPFGETEVEKVSGVLVDCIRKSLQWTPPLLKPDWLKDYVLPGEQDLLKELERVDNELKKMDGEKEILLKRSQEFEWLKGLLHETGKYSLEPSVRKAFCVIGFDVKEPDEYEEDYDLFAIEGEISIIGEIEGSTKIIDVWKYRQLLDYVEDLRSKGKKCKGVLIGNGLLEIDPSLRGEQFSGHAIEGCDRQKFCRMTTYELYKTVDAVLSNSKNQELKNLIKEKILSCDGEFKFGIP